MHTLYFILVLDTLVGLWSLVEKRWDWTVISLVVGFFGVIVLAVNVFGIS